MQETERKLQLTGKQALYVLLEKRQGEYVSGEELAGELCVSRNAIWKAVCTLREEGNEIEAVTGKGYRLTKKSSAVTEGEICSHLNKNGGICTVEVISEADSTNRMAKEAALAGAKEGTLLVARKQQLGKGRLGRSFFSPEGGIYMSVVLRPRIAAEKATFITTCAAVAVARAIEKETGLSAGIKWVNDIFVHGKKVCGILTEAGINFETGIPEYAVLGIGINVEKQSVPEELKGIVGCLEEETGTQINKSRLTAAVWNEFFSLYDELSTAAYMEEYKNRSVLLGKTVTVISTEGDYEAKVCDIDKDGHLVIEREGKKGILSSGEVSVRM